MRKDGAKLVEFGVKLLREIQRAAKASNEPSTTEWIRKACREKLEREQAARDAQQ